MLDIYLVIQVVLLLMGLPLLIKGGLKLIKYYKIDILLSILKNELPNTNKEKGKKIMDFFSKGVDVLQKLVILIGAGLGVWGVVNLLEGYGNDNPGAKSQGMKQFMSGAGIVLIATLLVPSLKNLFS
jgi:uncharacterized protein YacL